MNVHPTSGELADIRWTVTDALDAVDLFDVDVTVALGWTADRFVLEEMRGVQGRVVGDRAFRILCNTTVNGWADMLRATTVHEYAHCWLLHRWQEGGWLDGYTVETRGQDLLLEAHGQRSAAHVYPGVDTPWRDAVDQEACAAHWETVRDELDAPRTSDRSLFFGDDDHPRWLGYTLAWRIGERLQETYALDGFDAAGIDDLRVAGDEVFR